MKAFIQRYSQQQIGRFLTIALLPFLGLGTVGLIASGMIIAPLIVTLPVYAAGMYLYVGYARIGWFQLDYDKAQKIWSRSVWYNGFLAFCSMIFVINMLIDWRGAPDRWEPFFGTLLIVAGQITVAITAHNASNSHSEELKAFNTKIGEIGA